MFGQLTQKLPFSRVLGTLCQELLGQTALVLVRSGTRWRLAYGCLPRGQNQKLKILWLDSPKNQFVAGNPLLTLLDEGETVMGHCEICPSRPYQARALLKDEIAKWLPNSQEHREIACAIWSKGPSNWSVGLFAAASDSLQRLLGDQLSKGYRADRCLPESLALLAYHLARNPQLKPSLAIHIKSDSALFMIIEQSKILVRQTVRGDLSDAKTAGAQTKRQALQTALSLQLRFQQLFPQALCPPPWIATGLRDEVLWQSLNIELAPLDAPLTAQLGEEKELEPLIEGVFAMHFASMWPDANFLPVAQRSLSPVRLWLATRPLIALATAVAFLYLCNGWAKTKALKRAVRGEFEQLAGLMNAHFRQSPSLQDPTRSNAMNRFESISSSDLDQHLRRWSAQLAPPLKESGFEVLDTLLPLLARSAAPFWPQGLRIDQMLVQRKVNSKGPKAALHLQLICTAQQGETVGKFLDQIRADLPKSQHIKIVQRGKRASVDIALLFPALPPRVSVALGADS